MLSQKHAQATKVIYNSGFFITTNVLPDFGIERDQEAVYRRLKVFHTKSLPKKDTTSVTSKQTVHTSKWKMVSILTTTETPSF